MNSPGMVPPLILLTNSKPSPGAGSRLMTTWPNWPRPPVWRTKRATTFSTPLADRLAVGDLRLADVGVDFELAQHAVDDHLEVELAHAVDQRLAGFLVGFDPEGRVLLAEALQGGAHLLLVGFGLRLDRDRDHRLREFDALERDRRVRGGERVAGAGLLEADAGADVAGVDLLDLLAAVGVHHQQPADPLGLAGGDVEDAAAGLELARVDAEVGEFADVGVGHDLEGEGGEGGAVVGGALGLGRLGLAFAGGHDAGDRRHLERRGQQLDDRVEQRLHALVLERGAAEHRGDLGVETGAVQRAGDPLVRDLLFGQVGLHQLVVVVGAGLDQLGPVFLGLVAQVLGNLDRLVLGAELVGPDHRFHLDQVDDAFEVALAADRQLDRQRVGAEPVLHRLHGVEEVGAGAVHLVDVGEARHGVLVGLAPDGLRLGLDAGDGIEDGDGAVEHAQAALDLDREVDVAGRVDDVDPVALPLAGGRGGGDRDPALLLLLHPVHHGGALVDLAHFVGAAGVVEDALGRRRLTGVDVRHDPDVAGLL